MLSDSWVTVCRGYGLDISGKAASGKHDGLLVDVIADLRDGSPDSTHVMVRFPDRKNPKYRIEPARDFIGFVLPLKRRRVVTGDGSFDTMFVVSTRLKTPVEADSYFTPERRAALTAVEAAIPFELWSAVTGSKYGVVAAHLSATTLEETASNKLAAIIAAAIKLRHEPDKTQRR